MTQVTKVFTSDNRYGTKRDYGEVKREELKRTRGRCKNGKFRRAEVEGY